MQGQGSCAILLLIDCVIIIDFIYSEITLRENVIKIESNTTQYRLLACYFTCIYFYRKVSKDFFWVKYSLVILNHFRSVTEIPSLSFFVLYTLHLFYIGKVYTLICQRFGLAIARYMLICC